MATLGAAHLRCIGSAELTPIRQSPIVEPRCSTPTLCMFQNFNCIKGPSKRLVFGINRVRHNKNQDPSLSRTLGSPDRPPTPCLLRQRCHNANGASQWLVRLSAATYSSKGPFSPSENIKRVPIHVLTPDVPLPKPRQRLRNLVPHVFPRRYIDCATSAIIFPLSISWVGAVQIESSSSRVLCFVSGTNRNIITKAIMFSPAKRPSAPVLPNASVKRGNIRVSIAAQKRFVATAKLIPTSGNAVSRSSWGPFGIATHRDGTKGKPLMSR